MSDFPTQTEVYEAVVDAGDAANVQFDAEDGAHGELVLVTDEFELHVAVSENGFVLLRMCVEDDRGGRELDPLHELYRVELQGAPLAVIAHTATGVLLGEGDEN